MSQTIHQRQQLNAMRRSARRELRGNVVEWRQQALEHRIRTLPLPARKPASPLVSARVENIFLSLVAVGTLLVAHATGVLALIDEVVHSLGGAL